MSVIVDTLPNGFRIVTERMEGLASASRVIAEELEAPASAQGDGQQQRVADDRGEDSDAGQEPIETPSTTPTEEPPPTA